MVLEGKAQHWNGVELNRRVAPREAKEMPGIDSIGDGTANQGGAKQRKGTAKHGMKCYAREWP